MVTGDDPALKETVWVAVVPTVTFPKLKVLGETVNVPEVEPPVEPLALPHRATETLEALDAETLNVPVKVPVVLGTNFSWMLTVLPGRKYIGVVIPEYLNAPVIDALEILTVELPLLRKVAY